MERLPFQSPVDEGPIYYVATTGSTMDDAARLVEEGTPSGTVVVSDYQRSGRGRRPGRTWLSRAGESLMFTTAIHAPHHVTTASLCAGVAVARALQVLCDLDAKVKWPNDVMINDRKAAGILCDLTREWLLLGVGVNLLQKSFPNEIADSATSVVLAGGKPAERDALLRMILQELRPMVRPLPGETEDKWLADLRARLFAIGRLVVVRLPPDSEWQGVLRDVDDDGRLVLEKGGRIHRVVAGEIVLKL